MISTGVENIMEEMTDMSGLPAQSVIPEPMWQKLSVIKTRVWMEHGSANNRRITQDFMILNTEERLQFARKDTE
jgi:hypothetical protein